MHQRIADAVDNRFVQFGIIARRDEVDLLAELLAQVPDQTGHLLERRANRHHPQRCAGLLQFPGDLVQLRQLPYQVLRSHGPQRRTLTDHRLGDHQFPDRVQQPIEPFRVDLDDFLDGHGRLRAACCRLRPKCMGNLPGLHPALVDENLPDLALNLPLRLPPHRLVDHLGTDRPLIDQDLAGQPLARPHRAFSALGRVWNLPGRHCRNTLQQRRYCRIRCRGSAGLKAVAYPLHQAAQRIDRVKCGVDRRSCQHHLALAPLVQQVLRLVSQSTDLIKPQASCHTLDGMERPEHRVDRLCILRAGLQRQQMNVSRLQMLRRLTHEVL